MRLFNDARTHVLKTKGKKLKYKKNLKEKFIYFPVVILQILKSADRLDR